MTNTERAAFVSSHATRNGLVMLPPFRPRLWREPIHTEREGHRWVSGWEFNYDEPLGGERTVVHWLRWIQKRDQADALRLNRLYWSVRDVGGCHPSRSFALADVPAGMRHEAKAAIELFACLSRATWCSCCHSCPIAGPALLCFWCEAITA